MNQEVQDYIKKTREAGMSDEQIKQQLLKAGWQQNDINQEFNDATPVIVQTASLASAATQNTNPKNKSIFYYYLLAFKRYFMFKGRSRRKEYWSFVLINFIVSVLLGVFGFLIIKDRGILGGVFALIIMIPSIAVFVRRLHDIGKSGWWWFFNFVPFVGTIVLLVFLFKDGQVDANKYGLNPKTNGEDTKSTNTFLIIGIVVLLIAVGVLGYIYLIKSNKTENIGTNKDTNNKISEIKDYGSDLNGFADAAKNCSLAKAVWRVTNFDTIAEYSLELKPVTDGCSFSQHVDNINLEENIEEEKELINTLKKNGLTDIEAQTYLSEFKSSALSVARKSVGMTKICIYNDTSYLVKMLVDWSSGDFDSDKSGFAICTATDANGNEIGVSTSGILLYPNGKSSSDENGLSFNVSVITETQVNMIVTNVKTNEKQTVSLVLNSPITLFGHTLMISDIQSLGEENVATLAVD